MISRDVKFPREKSTLVITAFEIIDQFLDGHNGFAFLISGGVGSRFVQFHLLSQKNHGFTFLVKVYGRNEK